MKIPGSLYIVSTPIGNLSDITLRALEVLKSSDLILCENPNVSKKLLNHYEISTRLSPLFASTREEGFQWILKFLSEGNSISYISDAGTPGISDPGSRLVRAVREEGFQIIPIPGVSALSTILSISGSQVNPSVFMGFLSEKKGKKQKELESFQNFEGLIVFYESVHRIKASLDLCRIVFPRSEIIIGRELTKNFEEIIVWNEQNYEKPAFLEKGEFVVLINNRMKKMAKANQG